MQAPVRHLGAAAGSGIVAMAGLYALAVLILLGTRLQARRVVAANQEVVHVVE